VDQTVKVKPGGKGNTGGSRGQKKRQKTCVYTVVRGTAPAKVLFGSSEHVTGRTSSHGVQAIIVPTVGL